MIKAVIFDMDDLVIDSHPLHKKVFEVILNQYGVSLKDLQNPLTKEEEVGWFGLKISDVFKWLIGKYGLHGKADAKEMARQFDELMISVFDRQNVKPMPGLPELIELFKSHGLILVLASSARRAKIEVILKKLKLTGTFQATVSGEDEIRQGKPAPDIFLKAAEKVRVLPSECLVLEDAKNGVLAAKGAGMYCIGVHNKFAYERLGVKQDLSKADLVVRSLEEVNEETLTSFN